MTEKNDFYDEVSELRTGFGAGSEKPEFSSAVGGYSRAEVNRYIAEQSAAADRMKRVFYDKNQELRDEMQLLAQENRALRAAAESFVPDVVIERPEDGGNDAPDMRKLVEQVAAVLKGRHCAELRARDERIESMKAAFARDRQALEEKLAAAQTFTDGTAALEAELAKAKADAAQAEELRRTLALKDERIDSYARVLSGSDARIAHLTAELEQAKNTPAASREELKKRDDEIADLADKVAEREVEIRRGDLEIARLNATLLEKECELAKLRAAINEIAKLNSPAAAAEGADGRREGQYKDKEHGKIISPRFVSIN